MSVSLCICSLPVCLCSCMYTCLVCVRVKAKSVCIYEFGIQHIQGRSSRIHFFFFKSTQTHGHACKIMRTRLPRTHNQAQNTERDTIYFSIIYNRYITGYTRLIIHFLATPGYPPSAYPPEYPYAHLIAHHALTARRPAFTAGYHNLWC